VCFANERKQGQNEVCRANEKSKAMAAREKTEGEQASCLAAEVRLKGGLPHRCFCNGNGSKKTATVKFISKIPGA
jgi:hypothetical protein